MRASRPRAKPQLPFLAQVGQLGRVGGSNALKMLRRYPQGRHYRDSYAVAATCLFSATIQWRYRLPFVLRIFWRQNMVARHCSQIVRQENTLGRHYSRFRPFVRIAQKQYQSLAQSRAGKNRPRDFESANFGYD